MRLERCPAKLVEGRDTYSPAARKELFEGAQVSPILPYNNPRTDDSKENVEKFNENSKHISISGVQPKYSLLIKDGRMVLTGEGEQGTHILKPKITDHYNREFSPANEHLTMQIAAQVYSIPTAANGLCFFENGEIAYVTRRFDVAPNGRKYRKEDFASLAGLTSENAGENYKYDRLSYEDIADLLNQFSSAPRVDILGFFRLVVFNFLFCNGDAHLKNFSLLESSRGDFSLSPAYDLMNTQLHVSDTIFALSKGLHKEGDESHLSMGMYSGKIFLEWGQRIGLPEKSVRRELDRFCSDYPQLEDLVGRSFLSDKLKEEYLARFRGRRDSFLRIGLNPK